MKKLILCSMLAAFAVAVQAGDAVKSTAKAKTACAGESACSGKTAKKADINVKGAMLLVQK